MAFRLSKQQARTLADFQFRLRDDREAISREFQRVLVTLVNDDTCKRQ